MGGKAASGDMLSGPEVLAQPGVRWSTGVQVSTLRPEVSSEGVFSYEESIEPGQTIKFRLFSYSFLI